MATTITVTEDVTEVTVTETTTQLNITPQVTTVGVSAVDITAANTAQSVSLTPSGNISATNVQAGFNELASEVAFLSGADFTGDVTISNGELTVNGKVEAELFQGDIDGAVHFKGAVASGVTLTKGDVVYISGHSGQKTEVDKADASDSNKMPAFGIVAANPVGQNVDVVTFGTLKTINTSAYSEGDELFVSTTAGQLTSTAPSGEGNLVQKIAKVVRAHNSGNIKIMGAGRTNATPNLNNGNIFIGDSNNQASTANFATQVALAETSHDDVLVDGDFTSSGYMKTDGNGNYSVESGSIAEVNDLTTSVTWDNVPDANITESSVTQHQSAINITQSQVSDLQSYLEDREIKAEYHRTLGSSQNFSTTYSTMWREFSIPAYSEKRQHQIEIQSYFASGSVAVNNEAVINVEIKTPSANTAFSLGTATYEGSRGTYEDFVSVSGDITDKLSLGGSVGSSTTPSGFGIKSVKEFYYDADNNKTFICINAYPSSLVTNGNPIEIFFDPFDHESLADVWVVVDTFKVFITQNSSFKWENYTARLGYISEAFDFRIRVLEVDSGDHIAVLSNKLAITTRKV